MTHQATIELFCTCQLRGVARESSSPSPLLPSGIETSHRTYRRPSTSIPSVQEEADDDLDVKENNNNGNLLHSSPSSRPTSFDCKGEGETCIEGPLPPPEIVIVEAGGSEGKAEDEKSHETAGLGLALESRLGEFSVVITNEDGEEKQMENGHLKEAGKKDEERRNEPKMTHLEKSSSSSVNKNGESQDLGREELDQDSGILC